MALWVFGVEDGEAVEVARLWRKTSRWLSRVRAVEEEGCWRARVGQVWVCAVVSRLILALRNLDEVEAGQSRSAVVVHNV